MNYYPGSAVQPAVVAQDKSGYYTTGPVFPPSFSPVGIAPPGGQQSAAGMTSVGQLPGPYNQPPPGTYGLHSPYSGSQSYPALSSAAYGSSLQPGATYPGLAGHHTTVVPTSLGPRQISVPSSLPYQQPTSSYSQPTYLATPTLTSPEQTQMYRTQMAALQNPMYQSALQYSGYPAGVQFQPNPNYPQMGYSQASIGEPNPAYPGAGAPLGYMPRNPYK